MSAPRVRAAVLARVPRTSSATRGRAVIVYRYERATTIRRALAAVVRGGGVVHAPRRPVSSRMPITIIRQAQRNTCESAALALLLDAVGVRADQRELQTQLPRSGPPDPQTRNARTVWGDPDRGFVGRPDGGGTAGGFGVYPGPVASLARRHRARARVITGSSSAAVYRRLLAGRPVMAWVGLSSGPYASWRSPSGRPIKVNFGEHTVVLVGVTASGLLRVANPLRGTAELWTKQRFASMWRRLGRRAVTA